jgi:uncharacterized protein YyaL (SSP411 family)
MVGGILLADAEMNSAPLHLAVVGSKSDAGAAALFDSAARWPVAYKQVEWIDRAEPPLPGAAVIYPSLDRPAAYVCSGNACSSPAFDVITLAATIIRATKPAQAAPLGIFPIR